MQVPKQSQSEGRASINGNDFTFDLLPNLSRKIYQVAFSKIFEMDRNLKSPLLGEEDDMKDKRVSPKGE